MACRLPFNSGVGLTLFGAATTYKQKGQRGSEKASDDCTSKSANHGVSTHTSKWSLAPLVGRLGDYHFGPRFTTRGRGGTAAGLRGWNPNQCHAALHRSWPPCLLR